MHYCDVIMGAMASQIISLTIIYSIIYSGADQRKHQSSALLTHLMTSSWMEDWNVFSWSKFSTTMHNRTHTPTLHLNTHRHTLIKCLSNKSCRIMDLNPYRCNTLVPELNAQSFAVYVLRSGNAMAWSQTGHNPLPEAMFSMIDLWCDSDSIF